MEKLAPSSARSGRIDMIDSGACGAGNRALDPGICSAVIHLWQDIDVTRYAGDGPRAKKTTAGIIAAFSWVCCFISIMT
jgi:hypothetical protein